MNEPIEIPGYRTIRELGIGGMATVHLAIQASFDREVALKIMSPLFNVDPSFATRFVREARIISQIHHASIVPVHDVGEHRRHQYLSMEYLPGGDLKHRLQERGPDPALAITVCRAISSALELAHRKGFVHRDIKPENILFREDGTPVLTDFGIARAIDSGTSLTRVGTLVGTPAYMSPEQIKGVELDGRTDLYSLGIVLYEMLTGSQPFRADSTLSLALKHISEDLPRLPGELAQFQPVLDRLTAREREDRFASGANVMEALNRIDRAPRFNAAPPVAPVRNPTPQRRAQSEIETEIRDLPPPVPAATPSPQPPPLLPRSIRLLWIGLGTVAISVAVGMTYMTSRPASEPAAINQSVPPPITNLQPLQAAAPPAVVPAAVAANTSVPVMGPPRPAVTKTDAALAAIGKSVRASAKPVMEPAAKPPKPPKAEPPKAEPPPEEPADPSSGPLQIALNLTDRALWGEETWRHAAEPEKIVRFIRDDIRIVSLEMYAQDIGNGVARLGVRGNIANSSKHDRLVKLRLELLNGGEANVTIPFEIGVDDEEEEDFDKTLDIAADQIKPSPPTRLRISLSAVDD